MGTLTFVQLQDEVRSGLGGRTDLDARLPRAINLAQQRLARIHDFDEMEVISTTTIANTSNNNDRYLTLPNKREIFSIMLLDGANSLKLRQRTNRYIDQILPMPEYWTRDRPQVYVIWGSNIEIWPMPNTSYNLRMRWTKWPTDLVNSTNVSEFLQKDEILIELAIIYLCNSLGKEEDAAKHGATLRALLAEAITIDDTKPDLDFLPGNTVTGNNLIQQPWNNPFVRET